MAAVLAEFLAGALGSVTTKVVIFPFETVRVILAVRKEDYKVRLVQWHAVQMRRTTPHMHLTVHLVDGTGGWIG